MSTSDSIGIQGISAREPYKCAAREEAADATPASSDPSEADVVMRPRFSRGPPHRPIRADHSLVHVSVHHYRRNAEAVAQHHVGGLSANAGKGNELVHRRRHLPAEPF